MKIGVGLENAGQRESPVINGRAPPPERIPASGTEVEHCAAAPDPIGPAEGRELALLHRKCLPDTAVAMLGERYAERFYRYIAGSAKEHAFLHRDSEGVVDAACVVSLEPAGLNRRLWLHTPLVPGLLGKAAAGRRRALASALSPLPRVHRHVDDDGASLPLDAPEIVLIFVSTGRRRRGLGRALLERGRVWLRASGLRRCLARTLDDPCNRAADFYRATGFEIRGRSRRRGFQVWESGA